MVNTRKQGDIGVAEAIAYYTKLGYTVSIPITEAARYDLVVDDGKDLFKIQCKTSTFVVNSGAYQVNLRTFGGNQSWGGTVAKISSEETDIVFIWCSNDTLWEIPSTKVEGMTSVTLGNKYSEYLVEGSIDA